MIKTQELKFDEKGLIPAIVVDAKTKEVLTLAYMNAESLEITLKEKQDLFLQPQPSNALAQRRNERELSTRRIHYGGLR